VFAWQCTETDSEKRTFKMTTLSDLIFSGRKVPSPEDLLDFTVGGGSEQVEMKLREKGWTDASPAAAMLVDFDGGEVVNTHLHLFGFKEVGRVTADLLWGPPHTEKSYVKIDPVDFANFGVTGRMVSDWLPGDKVDWTAKFHNQETNRMKVVNKLADENLRGMGASKLWFRIHLALDKGPKLTCKLGVGPATDVSILIGHAGMNFPMIQIAKESKLELLPREPQDAEYGTGFMPLFNHVGEGEVVYPSWDKVKTALAEHFNNACKPRMKTKYVTWKNEVAKGMWEAQDPLYLWPVSGTVAPLEDGEEGQSMIWNCRECLWSSFLHNTIIVLGSVKDDTGTEYIERTEVLRLS
jgi:hypothetical protein